jgi:hypothetical protein
MFTWQWMIPEIITIFSDLHAIGLLIMLTFDLIEISTTALETIKSLAYSIIKMLMSIFDFGWRNFSFFCPDS